MPLPALDADPTEVAVPWAVLSARGHEVIFATPEGRPAKVDEIMLTGRGLPLVGALLRANHDARAAHAALLGDDRFQHPLAWRELAGAEFDGLILPGGHRARGMRPYLESGEVQRLTIAAFSAARPVGAICHGVLIAARSRDPATGRSVLHGRRTTSLTWALERSAAGIGRIARFWDPFYYRTYREGPGEPDGHMSVQAEVTRALREASDYIDVDPAAPDARRKTSGLERDTPEDAGPAFVVRDGAYVSARWPGDAHTFAATFADLLAEPIATAPPPAPASAPPG